MTRYAPLAGKEDEIAALASGGVSGRDLAARFGVSGPAINKVLRRAGIRQAPPRGKPKPVQYADRTDHKPLSYAEHNECSRCGSRDRALCGHTK